jgi:tetratricopeptide (TPR) repeat protein
MRKTSLTLTLAWLLALGIAPANAQTIAPPSSAPHASASSALDAPLFYQLLLGELDLRNGDAGAAFAKFLDVARRTRDDALFRRAVELALQARAGDQALQATRAWRQAVPDSLDALRFELQILAALNRGAEWAEPMLALLERTPAAERAGVIAGLPRLVQRASDKAQAAAQIERALAPWLAAPAMRTTARVALGRAWVAAGDNSRALQQAERAAADDEAAPGPVLLALELMDKQPAAEALVTRAVARPGAEPLLRLAYARALTRAQRYVDAESQLRAATRTQPEVAATWLSLGALQLELRQARDADTSLQRYLQLSAGKPATATAKDSDDEDDAPGALTEGGRTQALLLLAQAADQRGDAKAAAGWLDKIDDPRRALEVQTRRATLLARQGQVAQARALVRQVPEREPDDAKAKLVAESQVLREVKRWAEAHAVLTQAAEKHPKDVDLLYEQAMMAEKMSRLDDMERGLRRVIELKPDHHHAFNALGYSLAERGLRLTEARELIVKALEMAPADPFITDSLGWVEFRLGNHAQALAHLQRAYAARPDVEIAAHLGEVLWASGRRDDARRVWREGRERDGANEVLRETLARLQVRL